MAGGRRIALTWTTALALAAGGVVVYLVTRLVLLPRFPPFYDEGTYSWWTLQGFVHPDQRFASLDSQVQPFAMWLAMAFMKLGAGPLTAMRVDSLVAGLVTASCVVLLARRAGGGWTAVAAGALYVVLPYFVVHDVVGILDPVVVAAGMAALVLQLELARRPRLDLALLLGFAFAVGVLTKATGVYAMVLLPLSLLCFDWSPVLRWRRFATWLAYAVVAELLGVLGHLVTKLSAYNVAIASPNGAAPRTTRSIGAALAHPLRWADAAWPPLQHALTGYITWPLLLLAVVGAVVLARSQGRLAIVLGVWAVVPVLVDLEISQEQYPRLILESAPPIVVFAACGLVAAVVWAWGRIEAPWRWVVPAVVVLALLPALVLDGSVLASPTTAKYPGLDDWQYATGWPSGALYGSVAAELRQLASGHQHLEVVLSERVSYTLQIDMRHDANVAFVGPEKVEARYAPYVVVNGDSLPASDIPKALVPVETWHRTRDGDFMQVLQRGMFWKGKLYTDPTAWRSALGLQDKEFDAFLAHHRPYYRWYHAALG